MNVWGVQGGRASLSSSDKLKISAREIKTLLTLSLRLIKNLLSTNLVVILSEEIFEYQRIKGDS